MTALSAIVIAWVALAAVMAIVWLAQRATRNAGSVDVAWSFGTAAAGIWFAIVASGDPVRRLLIGFLVASWGLRLGVHLVRRLCGEAEDGRYRELRRKWGKRAQLYLLAFFQIQAVWAVLFALPMLGAAQNATVGLRATDVLGAIVWVVAIAGEAIADRQLQRFRSHPSHRGQVCRTGLWRYSRHPNYFFEWVHWWAYVLIGAGTPAVWLTWLGPALMLFFLFKVTGIPPTEARALASRGDAYREYQRTTSVFIPWPPKRAPEVRP